MRIEQVLLVDDDASIRKVAEISLSKVGNWRVFLAESGAQALDVVSREKPDVILLDVMMPGMDGPTTLKCLRESESLDGTPIIFMTAKVQKHEIESYYNLGAAGVISKPFDPMSLPSEIRSIVAGLADASAPSSREL
jgi:two-component system, OmpR family, response regulator